MSSAVYVVVKESGEYSQWNKENVCFYTDLEDAEEYVRLQNELLAIEFSDDAEGRGSTAYSVEVVKSGSVISDVAADVASAARDAAQKVQRRKTEKEAERKAAGEKWAQEKDSELKELAEDVHKFLNWWEDGAAADPYYQAKKGSMLRSMTKALPKYVELTNDSRASAWLSKHRDLIIDDVPKVPVAYNS